MTNYDSHKGSIDMVMQCRQQRLRSFPSDEQRGSRRQSAESDSVPISLILSIMASIFSCVRLGFRRVNLSITLPSLTVWPMTVPSARRRPRIPWSVSEGTRHGHWPWNATTGAWAGRGSRT